MKDFMKAKAGVLMLLIGMICFTGFGMTNTDLAENSNVEVFAPVDFQQELVVSVDLVVFQNAISNESYRCKDESILSLKLDAVIPKDDVLYLNSFNTNNFSDKYISSWYSRGIDKDDMQLFRFNYSQNYCSNYKPPVRIMKS